MVANQRISRLLLIFAFFIFLSINTLCNSCLNVLFKLWDITLLSV